MMFGNLLKDITDMHALHLSLATLIFLLTSTTCSDAALVLIMTSGIAGATLSNSMSIKIVSLKKPAQEHRLMILFWLHADCFAID